MGCLGWKQYELHLQATGDKNVDRKKLHKLGKQLEEYVKSIGCTTFYCNYYGGKDYLFIKFGIGLTSEEQATTYKQQTEQIAIKANELGFTVKEGTPDLRVQDGIVIDDIKLLSSQIAQMIEEKKISTVSQLVLLFHMLMNQLGFGYEEELDIYLQLMYNIRFRRSS